MSGESAENPAAGNCDEPVMNCSNLPVQSAKRTVSMYMVHVISYAQSYQLHGINRTRSVYHIIHCEGGLNACPYTRVKR